MRAMNLVPADERRGAGGTAGRSGGAAFVLLGLLALLVVVVTVSTLQKRSVSDKRTELVTLEAQATAADRRAAELTSFTQFAALRAARVQTVSTLAAGRFDWAHAMSELGRVIPSNVWLTALQGTAAPGIALKESGASGTTALRATVPTPAVELIGCTTDQQSVARMMARMRLLDGVTRVALQSSVRAASEGSGTGGGGASADCRQNSSKYPQFQLVVFFDPTAGAVPVKAAGVTAALTPAAAATVPAAPTGATTP